METSFQEQRRPGCDETSNNDKKEDAQHSDERKIPIFEVEMIFLKSLMRMQTGFEMKTVSRASERTSNLLRSISLTTSFVTAMEHQLNNLLAFTKRHVSDVKTRLEHTMTTTEEIYHLREVLLSLQATLIRCIQDLRNLAEEHDTLENSNAASDFLQSQAVLDNKNLVEDLIAAELANVYSVLSERESDEPQKLVLLRSGTVSGETRKQKHGYHVLGPAILLAAMWLLLIFTSLFAAGQNLDLMIRFFRGQLLVVTYSYLLGMNMMGWAKARIDYDHDHILPMGAVTPAHVFNSAGVLAALFGALMFLFLLLSAFIKSTWLIIFFAFVMWVLLAAFLFNPFDVVNRGARYFFIKHSAQVALSPLFPVLFSHAWYTDQLLSLVAVGLDLQYQTCYLIVDSWFPATPLSICSSSSTVIRPLITALPALWRILQSLRCFVQTWSPRHIVNAFKYITTIAVVVVSAAIELTQPSVIGITQLLALLVRGWVAVWVIAVTINIVFSHTWDVLMDWEAIRFNTRWLPYLRKQRLYNSVLFYYIAILSNLFFRTASALKTTLAVLRHTGHGDAIFTLLVFAELLRRFMWNFLRVELQWLKIQENIVF